jgi:hypothetical protein
MWDYNKASRAEYNFVVDAIAPPKYGGVAMWFLWEDTCTQRSSVL